MYGYVALRNLSEKHIAKIDDTQVETGGVHGDEGGHVSVCPGGALDGIDGPLGVVVAGASLGALHPTVARKEVAAEAVGLTVGLVGTEELLLRHRN